jgi:hypothetical protein
VERESPMRGPLLEVRLFCIDKRLAAGVSTSSDMDRSAIKSLASKGNLLWDWDPKHPEHIKPRLIHCLKISISMQSYNMLPVSLQSSKKPIGLAMG